ncbi:MAG: prolyl oligopeptidase family serine peptidase [Desulfobacteraceae bacterium]|jgi:predicted peptidase
MKAIYKLTSLFLISLLIGCAQIEKNPTVSDTPQSSGQHSKIFEKEITKDLSSHYLLFLPEGYDEQEEETPLILFLHGAGERGNDLTKVKVHGPPKIVEKQKDFPFIVVSPQCPEGQWWTDNLDTIINLLDEIITQYNVDEDRVYLTGLSMGGFGSWALAAKYPDRFAAIAPVCGGALQYNAYSLVNVPIWIFHGAKDTTVPVFRSQEMFDIIEKRGGDVKITIYPDAYHDSWTQTYDNPELYDWFLEHRLSDREK